MIVMIQDIKWECVVKETAQEAEETRIHDPLECTPQGRKAFN